ncbi:MAG: L-rhamnose isomerase, partial [Verrucomicrobia bacterium]|nr:L-rhamnose isomerase [Verrucomicrobiota bacterium]
ERLALLEEAKTLPIGAVWEEFLCRNDIPTDWMAEVRSYENTTLVKRTYCQPKIPHHREVARALRA